MKTAKSICSLVALGACALALAGLGSAKHPVTRPFQSHETIKMVLNLADGTWTLEGRGNGTHGGLFTNQGSGGGYGAFGSGTVTMANGATMNWVMPGTSWQVEWPGVGTGNVGNATGGFNVVWQSPQVQTPGPDENTVTIIYTYKGIGEIRY